MKSNSTAKVYARALFELAGDKNGLASVQAEFALFIAITSSSQTLRDILSSLRVSHSEKLELLKLITEKCEYSVLFRNFLFLLVEKNRIRLIGNIWHSFQYFCDVEAGVLRGIVTTAEGISEDFLKDLQQSFSQKFKKTILLNPQVDKGILGGLVVSLGDLTFDGSLKTSLHRLKHNLERQYV